jgi:hypothetical protein
MSSQLIVPQNPAENAFSCSYAYWLMFLVEGKSYAPRILLTRFVKQLPRLSHSSLIKDNPLDEISSFDIKHDELSEKDRLSSVCGVYGTPNRIVKWLHMLTSVNRILRLGARTFELNEGIV